MKFQVGDRVNVYASYMSNEPLRGTVVDNCASQKDNILLKVRFDNFRGISSHAEWIHAKQCRKLVKRRKFKENDNVRFKIGSDYDYIHGYFNKYLDNDLVEVYQYPCKSSFIHGVYTLDKTQVELVKNIHFEKGDRFVINIEGKKEKGTVLDNKNPPEYYVKFDNGMHGFFPLNYLDSKWPDIRKLVKKKTEFKVGDRVIFKNGLTESLTGRKGTISEISISSNGTVLATVKGIVTDIIYLKKLIKKKVKFYVGDRVSCETLGDRLKGTIEAISIDENVINVKVDNLKHMAVCRPKHLKKLVKKGKVYKSEQKPFFEWMSKIILKDLEKESKEQKLLPCPFCGSLECYLTLRNLLTNCLASIECSKCGSSSGEIDNEETAIKNWNRRSYP